mmetsp:Transcript_7536/g.23951  ORF Transcript_7536/g.23951 Transcript_7536/m.23951 type:complete len:246 (+) Transcript_7536:143-880(+)
MGARPLVDVALVQAHLVAVALHETVEGARQLLHVQQLLAILALITHVIRRAPDVERLRDDVAHVLVRVPAQESRQHRREPLVEALGAATVSLENVRLLPLKLRVREDVLVLRDRPRERVAHDAEHLGVGVYVDGAHERGRLVPSREALMALQPAPRKVRVPAPADAMLHGGVLDGGARVLGDVQEDQLLAPHAELRLRPRVLPPAEARSLRMVQLRDCLWSSSPSQHRERGRPPRDLLPLPGLAP